MGIRANTLQNVWVRSQWSKTHMNRWKVCKSDSMPIVTRNTKSIHVFPNSLPRRRLCAPTSVHLHECLGISYTMPLTCQALLCTTLSDERQGIIGPHGVIRRQTGKWEFLTFSKVEFMSGSQSKKNFNWMVTVRIDKASYWNLSVFQTRDEQ